MASRRSSSTGAPKAEEPKPVIPTPRPGTNQDDGFHVPMPGASSVFQEVMNELNPRPLPEQPPARTPRRRRSTHQAAIMKHMQNIPEMKKDEEAEALRALQERAAAGLLEEEEEEEEYDSEEEIGGPQILHGKCHCYFVKDGKVTGLADSRCHHEHRNHPLTHPSTHSPRLARKYTPSSSSPSPDSGSPRSRRKQQHLLSTSHSSSLFPPGMGEFRSRSHSDTTAMARIVNAKRAGSLAPSSLTPPNNSARRGSRRTSSLMPDDKEMDELSDSVSASLRVSSPPSILVQEVTVPELPANTSSDVAGPPDGYASRVRRSSAHTIPSEQLHYLYDQFLSPGGGGVASH